LGTRPDPERRRHRADLRLRPGRRARRCAGAARGPAAAGDPAEGSRDHAVFARGHLRQPGPGVSMNVHAIGAIYRFEMARTWRTITQSIISPVLSTALYFVVFGSAIGSRIERIGDVTYGAFIVPGLIMLSVLTQSIANASFG